MSVADGQTSEEPCTPARAAQTHREWGQWGSVQAVRRRTDGRSTVAIVHGGESAGTRGEAARERTAKWSRDSVTKMFCDDKGRRR